MKKKDYYQIIGVPRTATQEEIRLAYRKLARKYHPDVSQDTDAELRFKEIGEANAVLKDPEKRAAYDLAGATGQAFQPPPEWGSGFDFGTSDVDKNSDFIESLFGRHGDDANRRGQDQHAKVEIALEDAYSGVARSISLRVPGIDEKTGRVVMQERTLNVHIPRGIHAGQHLRLSGQGAPGAGSGSAGDLYLEISFRAHPQFRVEVRDVFMDLPLSPWEATLGCTLPVALPEGSVNITIPAGSATGRQLRLKGRGIPGQPPGDLYVVLSIVQPPAVSKAEIQAYRSMAQAFVSFNPRLPVKGNTQ
jgi:curved DNA-binding protein